MLAQGMAFEEIIDDFPELNKRKLYFANGAAEVWVCSENGTFEFFTKTGKSNHSLLVPIVSSKIHDA